MQASECASFGGGENLRRRSMQSSSSTERWGKDPQAKVARIGRGIDLISFVSSGKPNSFGAPNKMPLSASNWSPASKSVRVRVALETDETSKVLGECVAKSQSLSLSPLARSSCDLVRRCVCFVGVARPSDRSLRWPPAANASALMPRFIARASIGASGLAASACAPVCGAGCDLTAGAWRTSASVIPMGPGPNSTSNARV
ncbi:hypothetical protein M885DRAFT_326754 [Pelagophyceae sp. CCMP2097]|nr:hypothetical protein M885DRAFT_326754 [Pelagophyceae sp. CCMP2097]|mmetsp:Transcript_9352/g.30924  ORF Transcript_9352/g.30924 Transcript_9352/m.30924 type:complete len:201 (-) Transcript_9352:391-993(-)